MLDWKSLAVFFVFFISGAVLAQNYVLELDGDGDYLQLPSEIFNELDQATVEGWFKWQQLGRYPQFVFFQFGGKGQTMTVKSFSDHRNTELGYHILDANGSKYTIDVPNILRLNQWCHFAAVSGEDGMKLYLNGILVGQDAYNGSFSSIHNGRSNLIGYSNDQGYQMYFQGQMDEIRVWKVARSAEQIQGSMLSPLRGNEPGLVCYWNFEDHGALTTDASVNRWSGQLFGQAKRVKNDFPSLVQLPTVITGSVYDQSGMGAGQVTISLKRGAKTRLQVSTSDLGHYRMVSWLTGEYDLYATQGTVGQMRVSLQLHGGQPQEIDLRLEPALNISGRLLHLNSMIPHIAVQVQALMLGKSQDEEARVMATVLSDKNGVYRFVNLRPGQYQLRCYTTRGHVYYQDKQSLQVVIGKEIQNVDFRFAAFKKGRWKSYTRFDGLPGNVVWAIQSSIFLNSMESGNSCCKIPNIVR